MAKRQAQSAPRTIKLHPEQYERLKDKARIAQFVEAQAQQMVAAARAEVAAAMAKLGLDTSEGAAYDFDDATCSVVKRPMPSAEVTAVNHRRDDCGVAISREDRIKAVEAG